jgi:hypothetical protein
MAEPETETAAAPVKPLPLALIGRVAAIGGAALVVLSSFPEWAGRNYLESFGGFEIPAKFVIDNEANLDGPGLSLGLLVLAVGIVGLVGALVPRLRLLVLLSGAAAVVIALLFAYQLNEFLDRANRFLGGGGFGVRNTVGVGGVLTGLGGLTALAGAALGLFAARRGPDATEHETRGES